MIEAHFVNNMSDEQKSDYAQKLKLEALESIVYDLRSNNKNASYNMVDECNDACKTIERLRADLQCLNLDYKK